MMPYANMDLDRQIQVGLSAIWHQIITWNLSSFAKSCCLKTILSGIFWHLQGTNEVMWKTYELFWNLHISYVSLLFHTDSADVEPKKKKHHRGKVADDYVNEKRDRQKCFSKKKATLLKNVRIRNYQWPSHNMPFFLNDLLSSMLWNRRTNNKFKTAAILTEMIQ